MPSQRVGTLRFDKFKLRARSLRTAIVTPRQGLGSDCLVFARRMKNEFLHSIAARWRSYVQCTKIGKDAKI
jgi:hypothetical protein